MESISWRCEFNSIQRSVSLPRSLTRLRKCLLKPQSHFANLTSDGAYEDHHRSSSFLFIFPHFALTILESTHSSPSMPLDLHASNLAPRFVPMPVHSNLRPSPRGLGINTGVNSVPEYDVMNLKFAEAREEIEMAMESKESVYFNEEAECARASVKEVIDLLEGFPWRLPEAEKAALRLWMGLKMEQLKAELICDL